MIEFYRDRKEFRFGLILRRMYTYWKHYEIRVRFYSHKGSFSYGIEEVYDKLERYSDEFKINKLRELYMCAMIEMGETITKCFNYGDMNRIISKFVSKYDLEITY